MDILISDATLVTLNPARQIIERGSLVISDGRIARLGHADELRDATADLTIDGRRKIVLPGLVNPHVHLSYTLARGCGDDLPFLRWLPVVYRIEDGYSEEEWYLTALLTMLEMIKSGTTCFADTNIYEEFDTVAHALEETGMRGVLGKNVRDLPAKETTQSLVKTWQREHMRALSIDTALENYGAWHGQANGRVMVRIAPSVWPVCSTATYREVARVTRAKSMGKLIHHTETSEWNSFVHINYGKAPTMMLQDFGILGPDTLLENATSLTAEEIATIAATDTRFNYLPTSNVKNYLGVLDVAALLERGITVSLGTSGGLINNINDMFHEMNVLALQQRMLKQRPDAISPETVLEMTTIGGAKALNLEREIGSLEVGKRADLIVVNANQPHLLPLVNPISTLVYCANGTDVETTIIDGKVVMLNRKLQTVDEAAILDRAWEMGLKALGRIGVLDEPQSKSRWPHV